jgi:spore coat protein U-like protein
VLVATPALGQSACRVSVSNLDFGTYSTRAPAPRNNIGAVDVACTGQAVTPIARG